MESAVTLPATEKEWLALVEQEDIKIKTIHQEGNFSSASKFGLHHFLQLRVLWETVWISEFDSSQFGLSEWLEPAKVMLKEYRSWDTFIKTFGEKCGEGNFFLAKIFQEEAYQVESTEMSDNIILSPVSKRTRAQKTGEARSEPDTPSKTNLSGMLLEDLQLDDYMDEDMPMTPEVVSKESPFGSIGSWANQSWGPKELWSAMYPRAKDEQIVNTALINFLRAITSNFSFLSIDWTIEQKAFKAIFNSGEYIARTDGYFKDKVKGDVRALVEVKACLRYLRLPEICVQESAQMVAWLKAVPPNPGELPFRRFHVSQDRHEIWLIFALYDERYLDYLKGRSTERSPLSFMTMYQVGPWDTQSKEAMAHLGPILLALALRSHEENVTRDGKQRSH